MIQSRNRRLSVNNLLPFYTFCAPFSFSIQTQELDIYTYFCNHVNPNKRIIYSVAASQTSTTLASVPSNTYAYGENVSGVMTEYSLGASGTIAWTAGSTQRYVLFLSASGGYASGFGAPHAVWMFIGLGVSTAYGNSNGTLKYVHYAYRTQNFGSFTLSPILGNLTPNGAIGTSYFQGCNSITSIDFSRTTSIANQAFYSVNSITGTLRLTGNVTSVGSLAFVSTAITSVIIENSGLYISATNSFTCTNTTTLFLPSGYIGNGPGGKTFTFSTKLTNSVAGRNAMYDNIMNKLVVNFGTFTIGTTNLNNLITQYPNVVAEAASRGITLA